MVLAKGLAVNTHWKCYPQIPVVFPEALTFLASPQIPRNIFKVCPVTRLWLWLRWFSSSALKAGLKNDKNDKNDKYRHVLLFFHLPEPSALPMWLYLVKQPPHVFNTH